MKSFILTSLVASASAFAPAGQGASSTQLHAFADGMVGSEGEFVLPAFVH